MLKCIITIGIPGSGKSKWARETTTQAFWKGGSNIHWQVIERDMIRHELYGCPYDYKYTEARETAVKELQVNRIITSLGAGVSVIISDTNLNEHYRLQLHNFAEACGAEVEYKVFDVPLKDCIKNNMKRDYSVPESSIIRMESSMRAYLNKPMYNYEPGLPNCIIVDIDGTIAEKGDRVPYDWMRVGEDTPRPEIIRMLRGYVSRPMPHVEVFFFSGRDEVCRPQTCEWLVNRVGINYTWLAMRPEGNNDADTLVKENMYIEQIHGKFNVDFVMDDRKQVCQMWESLGLPLINVGGTTSDF